MAAQRLRPLSEIQRKNSVNAKQNIVKIHQKPKIEKDSSFNWNQETVTEYKKKNYHDIGLEENTNKIRHEDVLRVKMEKCYNSVNEQKKDKAERDVPSKKFYFGMEDSNNEIRPVNKHISTNNVDKTNAEHRMTAVEKSKNLMNLYKSSTDFNQNWEENVDKFAANYHKAQMAMVNGNTTSCSSSFVSDPDEDVSFYGIKNYTIK